MRHAHLIAASATACVAASAFATVTGTTAFGDAYLVVDGAKTYSVLDVYMKSNNANDIFSSVAGVSAYKASWILQEKVIPGLPTNSAVVFRHAGNSSWNANYAAASNASWNPTSAKWDSFVTTGMRVQDADSYGATPIALTSDPGFSNMNTANAGKITGATTGNGPGWYPAAGANPATNPYCKFGYYNGASNLAKATTTIAGNGITAGQSLDNHFMIARVALDTADMVAGTTYTFAMKFTFSCVSDGVSKNGSTDANFRINQSLTFVPGPGALAAVSLAAFLRRRRTA